MSRAELTLHPSRRKALLTLLVSGLFTAVGVMMVVQEGDLKAWLVMLFFGACTLVFIALLMPGASYLRLRPDGFTVCSLWRAQTYRWRDVGTFAAGYVGPNRGVVFDMAPDYQPAKGVRGLVKAGLGHEGALPDTYGRSADELAALMNEWRGRHGHG